jgi:hypothetical protein
MSCFFHWDLSNWIGEFTYCFILVHNIASIVFFLFIKILQDLCIVI